VTFVLSGALVLMLGGLGLWAGHDAGAQAEATHRADRLAHQATLGSLVGQSTLVAAAELADILAAQTRAGTPAWRDEAIDAARLRATAEGSRALSAGAVLISPDGLPVATYHPSGGLLPQITDTGWAPLRAAVARRDGTVPVSGVLMAGEVPVTAVAVATRFADGRTGLLVGLSDLRSSALERYVRTLVNPDGRRAYVLDGRGLVVAGPDPDEVGRPLDQPAVRAAVLGGTSGVADVREGDRELVVSYAKAGESGWYSLAIQDRARFLGALQKSARRAQVALVLLLLCAGSALLALHRRREAVLREATIRDDLTGALNRRGWYDAAARQLERAARDHDQRGLLFMDLDGLKTINDTLGHVEGDRAIVAAAELLRSCTRSGDVLGRLGGDEFVLLLADGAASDRVRDRIAFAIGAYNAISAEGFELHLSIGTAEWSPESPWPLDELVRRADADMYADKDTRRTSSRGVVRLDPPVYTP
jgi:diguanylate cyclase (GGDEF)-like protein